MRDNAWVKQLPNWYSRDMSNAGEKFLIKLLKKYSQHIPDQVTIYNAYLDEQLNKMAP